MEIHYRNLIQLLYPSLGTVMSDNIIQHLHIRKYTFMYNKGFYYVIITIHEIVLILQRVIKFCFKDREITLEEGG